MTPKLGLRGRSRAAFMGFRGRERASTFYKGDLTPEYIRRGMRFRRVNPDRSIETVCVLSVISDDREGTQVRFAVDGSPRGTAVNAAHPPRTLKLSAFAAAYRQRAPHA